jgi:hypothetical protein
MYARKSWMMRFFAVGMFLRIGIVDEASRKMRSEGEFVRGARSA